MVTSPFGGLDASLLTQLATSVFYDEPGKGRRDGHELQWQRLQREPGLLPGAVRELLRYDCPVQYTGRRVATDLKLHGQHMRRGDLVIALIGSANRDPERYADADRLDIARHPGGQLSFGAGPHVCIGAGLTLMEAQIVFGRLVNRFPGLQRINAQPQWNGNSVYRGLSALPARRLLTLGP